MIRKNFLQHYFLLHLLALRISFRNIVRTPITTFITIATIGACLCLPAGLYLFVNNMQQVAQGWETQARLTLYVDAKSSPQAIEQLLKQVQNTPGVEKATFTSPTDALREFETHFKIQDTLTLLPENPLPGAIGLQLTALPSQATLEEMKQTLSRYPNVQSVDFDQVGMQKLNAFLAFGKTLAHFSYLLFGISVILMVGNTLRLALERHRDEIEVLTLVGATAAFIRRPFLYRGVLYGGCGSLIAIGIISLACSWLTPSTGTLLSLYQSVFSLEKLSFYDTVVLGLVSMTLGWLGAIIAFAHHRRMVFQEK